MKTTAELLAIGHQALRNDHSAAESGKLGTLRGGSSGAVVDGHFLGKCHRVAHARFLGHQVAADANRQLMFDGGFANEDIWFKVLTAGYDGPILREEEIPVVWTTTGGVLVTGRPDVVLCETVNGAPVPVRGLELKAACAVGTAIDVLVRREPKTDHLIQAAHYAWRLGIPYELWYAGRVDWAAQGWVLKALAGVSAADVVFGESVIQYTDAGRPKKILPFYAGFALDFDDTGVLHYKPLATADAAWVRTEVSKQSIEAYYEFVGKMKVDKTLGPRPSNKSVHLAEAGFNKCAAAYCPFSAICDNFETSYEDWVSAVKELCQ